MLKDIPYCVLKQDERGYEIMLLRDLYGNTYTDIAKKQEISVTRVLQLYDRVKCRQIYLYINHIAFVFGHSDTSEIRKIYSAAYDCYQDVSYASAYLEKKYKDILTEYRNGEPGMPVEFVKRLPCFRERLTKKEVDRMIEMREIKKATFIEIAKEMRVTPEKARQTYDTFYHKKALKLIEALQAQVKNKEKYDICKQFFRGNTTPKKRYDMLLKAITFAEDDETKTNI